MCEIGLKLKKKKKLEGRHRGHLGVCIHTPLAYFTQCSSVSTVECQYILAVNITRVLKVMKKKTFSDVFGVYRNGTLG